MGRGGWVQRIYASLKPDILVHQTMDVWEYTRRAREHPLRRVPLRGVALGICGTFLRQCVEVSELLLGQGPQRRTVMKLVKVGISRLVLCPGTSVCQRLATSPVSSGVCTEGHLMHHNTSPALHHCFMRVTEDHCCHRRGAVGQALGGPVLIRVIAR